MKLHSFTKLGGFISELVFQLKFRNIPLSMNNLLHLLTWIEGFWSLIFVASLLDLRLGRGGSYCKQLEEIVPYLPSIYRHRCN